MTSFQERLRVRLISLSQNPIKAIWIACTLISMVYGVLVYAFVWHDNGKPRFERIIKSDGLGYYRYLPDIFITNDIKNLPDDALHFAKVDGHNVNKYYDEENEQPLVYSWPRTRCYFKRGQTSI